MCLRKPLSAVVSAILLIATALASIFLAGCATSSVKANASKTTGGQTAPPIELRVSAASSLSKAFRELEPVFEKDHNVDLVFNFAASGVLQRQIEGGAPADLFASAGSKQMDALIAGGFISPAAVSTFAANDLVIAVPKGNPADIEDPDGLTKAARLAIGNPDTAPHGTAAKMWLETIGLWPSVRKNVIYTENVAQTDTYISRGEVDAGIVFGSDVSGNEDLAAVYTVPEDETEFAEYVVAPLKDAGKHKLAEAFSSFLTENAAQKILENNGFLPE